MKAKTGIMLLLALVCVAVVAASTQAASSRPAAGDWTGKLVGVKPKTAVNFDVTASGSKRVVSRFGSSGEFDPPCHGALPTGLSFSNMTVSKAGTIKSKSTEDNGFGEESWTLAGKFKGGRATGTVAIVLALSATKRCDFTVKWSASLQAAGQAKEGATYKGTETAFSKFTVKFTISANGKELKTVTWDQPLVGNCPGVGSTVPPISGTDVPIHGSKFSYTKHTGKISNGTGTETTETITGQFLAGGKASGTVSTNTDESSIGNVCDGSDTWSAKS
jgi:hypothetical protein